MTAELEGKTAVVTGGSSGIGLASARLFAEAGARVVVVGRNARRLEEAVVAIGHGATSVAADLSGDRGATLLAEELERRRVEIDVLFANAGASNAPDLFDTTDETFDEVIGVNLKGPFFTVVRCFDLLRPGASVIMTSSVSHDRGSIGDTLYAAAKAGVRTLVRGFAGDPDFLERGVRVNSLAFGAVATPMTGSDEPGLGQALVEWAHENVPLKRWAHPMEAARPALFLASDASSYMTGSEVAVDGGLAQL